MMTIDSPTFIGLPAIIGGTGIEHLSDVHDARREIVRTRWGQAVVTLARHRGRDIVFLHRHTAPNGGRLPPHRLNYRANIAALKTLGVSAIFASTAVGSLRREWRPGTLVLLDQFVDFTSGRDKTFFDDTPVHVDVTQPYSPELRALLQSTSSALDLDLQSSGTYLCTDGPRFETPAEIRLFAAWGADVVGMTGVPEATLAREANISYAGVSIVTNLAAGISPESLTQAEVMESMQQALPRVIQLFLHAAHKYRDDPTSLSRRATDEFRTADFDPQQVIVAPAL